MGVKGVKYLAMEGNLTLGDAHTVQCTHDILFNCTREIDFVLLTKVTQ